MFYPDEPWREYISLGLIQVCLQDESLKNSYHFCQRCLHPDRISIFYLSVIGVEAYVLFPCQPPKIVLSLLRSTDLRNGRPVYCIHYDIKQCRGYRVSLPHPYTPAEWSPVVLPDFETTLCPSQYRCSNCCSRGPRPYSCSISMYFPQSSEW